jgi:hypothetical protein
MARKWFAEDKDSGQFSVSSFSMWSHKGTARVAWWDMSLRKYISPVVKVETTATTTSMQQQEHVTGEHATLDF